MKLTVDLIAHVIAFVAVASFFFAAGAGWQSYMQGDRERRP